MNNNAILFQPTGEVRRAKQREWFKDSFEGMFEQCLPARTLKKENAKEFKTITEATKALTKAREYRPFPKAVITDGF